MVAPIQVASFINPDNLMRPHGYSHGAIVPAGRRLLAVAGQIGWDAEGRLADGFTAQFAQALGNVVAVVAAAGGRPDDVVSLRIYVVDKREYLAARKDVGQAYRNLLGRHYPPMALVQVADLLEEGARVEIEALAAIAVAPPAETLQ